MTEILAIDDDREILAVIKKALLREGYQVTALEDPLQLEEDKLGRYQLILLDVMMPGIDGFDLCRRIREKVDCPILILTAKIMMSTIKIRITTPPPMIMYGINPFENGRSLNFTEDTTLEKVS